MRKLLLIAGLLGLQIGAATADQFDAYRVACTPDQVQTIETAIAETRRLATDADGNLPPVNSAIGAKFKRWFGGPDGDSDELVKKIYQEIAGFLIFKKYWCPNASLPFIETDPETGETVTMAFVPDPSFDEIFLIIPFFSAKTSGANSQAGTILHEISHQSTLGVVVDTDVTGDAQPDYGTANAEQLARTDATKARRTADNYEYFAEDLAFGIP